MPKAHPSTLTGQLVALSQGRTSAPLHTQFLHARSSPRLTLPPNPAGEYRRGFERGEKTCTEDFDSHTPIGTSYSSGESIDFQRGVSDGCKHAKSEYDDGYRLGDLDCRRKVPFTREIGGTSASFQKGYRKGCDRAIKIRAWCVVHRDECVGPAWFPYVGGG